MTPREAIESIKSLSEAFRGSSLGWLVDLADVVILAYIFYQLALLIKGTRAVQMMTGVVFILACYSVAGVMQLTTVQRFLGYLLYWIPFALIVIFQNTIRRLLSRFGHNPFSHRMQAGQAEALINEVVLAAMEMAKRRIGGLIVIEREQGLRNFTETGIEIDAVVSRDLLLSIFQHDAPLHDGAVVIQEGRIRAASCFLPLTVNPALSKEFGSRHRAAIGLTEETDALCVVTSEERGTVSAAFEGKIQRYRDADALREFLTTLLGMKPKSEPEPSSVAGAARTSSSGQP